jgi:hypothetical protein
MTAALRWLAWARWPWKRSLRRSGTQRFSCRRGWVCRRPAILLLTHMAGVDRQAGIALALVKRMREVLFGCIALAGWQLAEMRRNSRSRLT